MHNVSENGFMVALGNLLKSIPNTILLIGDVNLNTMGNTPIAHNYIMFSSNGFISFIDSPTRIRPKSKFVCIFIRH